SESVACPLGADIAGTARPAHQPFASAALLIFGMACRTLGRAQGRALLPEALPRRGWDSSPGRRRSSGQYGKSTTLSHRSDFGWGPLPRCSQFSSQSRQTQTAASGRGAERLLAPSRSYNDLARRNGSRHCRDATIAEGKGLGGPHKRKRRGGGGGGGSALLHTPPHH